MKYCLSLLSVCIIAALGAATVFAAPPPASSPLPTPKISPNLPPPARLPIDKVPYPITQGKMSGTAGSSGPRTMLSITQGLARLIAFESNILAVFFSDENVLAARALNSRTVAITGRAPGQATLVVFTQQNPKDVVGVANFFRVTVQSTQDKIEDRFDASEVTEISLQRTSCFGSCSVDKVTLRSDGTAVYNGIANVERIGRYKGKFWKRPSAKPQLKGAFELPEGVKELDVTPPDYFLGIVELLRLNKFFEMTDSYGQGEEANDFPTVIISAVRSGKRKTVINRFVQGSIALWGIAMAMRGVAAEIKWQKAEPADAANAEKSGIRGVAMAGPVRPVDRFGDPPNERPLAGAVITIQPDGGGKEITRKRADEKGRFEIALAPGTYLLVPLAPWANDEAPPQEPQDNDLKGDAVMLPRGTPQTVFVQAGDFTEVTVDYDTGIR